MARPSPLLFPEETCFVIGADDGFQKVAPQFFVHLLRSLCRRRRCERTVCIVMQGLQRQIVDGSPDITTPVRGIPGSIFTLVEPANHVQAQRRQMKALLDRGAGSR